MDTKTIIITGGLGGVGQAAAARLARDGYRVILWHRSAAPQAAEFVATLPGEGHEAYACDVTEPLQVAEALAAARALGRIYGCVHTAAPPIVRKAVLDLEPEELMRHFDAEVRGAFAVFKAVAPALVEGGGGVIIGITSMFIEQNHRAARMGAYIPAKFALRGLLRELASELAPHQVRVNAVAPSMMRTNMSRDLPERLFDFVKEKNPMKSLLTPEEVAGVISFLCSDDARGITGVSLPIAYGEVETL